MTKLEKGISFIVKNWDKIPDKLKQSLKPSHYSQDIKDLSLEEHIVVLLLNRQKPSVQASYDFDEERIGVTKTGKIVWGFDSGCSCPSLWDDSYPGCYKVSKSWKQFEINLKDFDKEVQEDCLKTIEEVKEAIKK